MNTVRSLIPWIAGAAWGLVFAIVAFAWPYIGIPGLIIALLVALVTAVRHRRTLFLSGLLIGLGGTVLITTSVACIGVLSCERAEAAPTFAAVALALVAGGLVALAAGGLLALRADRAT